MDLATFPDLLRLLSVPVFGWAAYRDFRTRRVPNRTWYPLLGLALLCLVWDGWLAYANPFPPFRLFVLDAALAVAVVVPLAYAFWWVGAVGGADAKAFMVLAVLFPSYPTYYLPGVAIPLEAATLRVFPLTVITNAILVGALYPLALGARNALAGRFAAVALVGLPVPVSRAVSMPGRLLETPAGFTRNGLDLDALRMYLRWRGLSLADLRANPDLRNPATLPERPNPPTDGAVRTDGRSADGANGASTEASGRGAGANHRPSPGLAVDDDPWGAAAFLHDIDGDAYGTTPETLREGLDLLVERERVWVSPGMPFVVPLVVGLALALTYGDLLAAALALLGVT